MDEDEMVGRQVKGAVHLLTASSQLDVFDLVQVLVSSESLKDDV